MEDERAAMAEAQDQFQKFLEDEALKTTEEKKEQKPKYVSKDGFETAPLIRGFGEISPWWQEITDLGGVVCGGYARYCASPRLTEKVIGASDVDIFPRDEPSFDRLVGYIKDAGLEPKHENPMSLTYKIPKEGKFTLTPTVQLIKPVQKGRIVSLGDTETILRNFDFTIIRAAIVSPTECLVDADFAHDEPLGILRLKNIHCPISSTLRCMKYSRKGYWLRPMEALKLFLDWDNRGEDYRRELVDYLTKANSGEGLTQEEVDHLEALMRID